MLALTAQSLLCGAADGIPGVADDGRGEPQPSGAAPHRPAGERGHQPLCAQLSLPAECCAANQMAFGYRDYVGSFRNN